MSESDDGGTDRNLAREYADRYGGSDDASSWFSEESGEESLALDPPSPADAAEADPEITELFWRLVLVFNVAIAALALGPMLIYFRGSWELGLQVTLLGALTFGYGTFRYHRFRADQDDGERNG